MSERIGLFGGSFDPVHRGHQKIIRSFLESGKIDAIWVLPLASPPHKKNRELSDFNIRFKMAEGAFANLPGVLVVRFEERLPYPNYTLRTLNYLQAEYPGNEFYLCIGSDSLQNITSWYKYDQLLTQCKLLVARRPASEIATIPPEASVHFVEHELVSYSSSEIRKKISKGEPVGDMVPADVLEIIEEHGLYRYEN